MRHAFLIAMLTLPTSACTSLRPVEEPSQQLQRRIVTEELLTPGDEVRVVTQDGRVHEFQIAEIDVDQGRLTGKDEVVRIDDIVALEKRRQSWIKTGGLILLGVLVSSTFGCGNHCGDGPYPEPP